MMVKIIKDIGRRLYDQIEKLEVSNKELEHVKNQTEMKNIITEMKNTLEGINIRLDDTKEWISELKDRVVATIKDEKGKEKE